MTTPVGSQNARELQVLCGTVNNAADVIEGMYDQSEYPGTLVVENVVRLLREETSTDDFATYFTTEGKTENVEWYLMHIISTLTEYRAAPHIDHKVYEWW
jgi:hypothetical protein